MRKNVVLLTLCALVLVWGLLLTSACGKSEIASTPAVQRVTPVRTLPKAAPASEPTIAAPSTPVPVRLMRPVGELEKGVFTKIGVTSDGVEVSSFNSPGQSNRSLVDGNNESHWHVKFPPDGSEHWIVIDPGGSQKVEAVGVMPNIVNPKQIWGGDHAVLQGSEDRVGWVDVVRLYAEREKLQAGPQWLYYGFENPKAYRYYRLLISDSQFLSLAEIELYDRQ